MQVGRPWGKACQPVLFDVAANMPLPIYADVATVGLAEPERTALT